MEQPEPPAEKSTEEICELQRQYVKRWEVVGPMLEQIRMEELRALTSEEAWRVSWDLLEFSDTDYFPPHREQHSGLIEQQRLFAKLRPA